MPAHGGSVPLALVLWFHDSQRAAFGHPSSSCSMPTTTLLRGRCPAVSRGGVGRAIVGTAIMVGIASLIAVPVRDLGGIYHSRVGVAQWSLGPPWQRCRWIWNAVDCDRPVHLRSWPRLLSTTSRPCLARVRSRCMLPIVVHYGGAVSLIPVGFAEVGPTLGLPTVEGLFAADPRLTTARDHGHTACCGTRGRQRRPCLHCVRGPHAVDPRGAFLTVYRYRSFLQIAADQGWAALVDLRTRDQTTRPVGCARQSARR